LSSADQRNNLGMFLTDRRRYLWLRRLYAIIHWGLIDLDFNTLLRRMAQLVATAFAGIILVTWVNEIYDLPYLMGLSDPSPVNYYEAAIETFWALFVLFLVLVSTRALLKQIRYLEGFLPVCSFCKKIRNDEGQWIELEQFMHEQTRVQMTHSLCPPCAMEHYGYEEEGHMEEG